MPLGALGLQDATWQVCEEIQNFEKIHGWMDKIGFIWIKYGDFFKNGFFQKRSTIVWGK